MKIMGKKCENCGKFCYQKTSEDCERRLKYRDNLSKISINIRKIREKMG